jgi:hypothetical protein
MMHLALAPGVPLAVFVSTLQEKGLQCTIEQDTLRVRWSPRLVATDETGETFAAQFLRLATAGDD